jgi:hypothetical protein
VVPWIGVGKEMARSLQHRLGVGEGRRRWWRRWWLSREGGWRGASFGRDRGGDVAWWRVGGEGDVGCHLRGRAEPSAGGEQGPYSDPRRPCRARRRASLITCKIQSIYVLVQDHDRQGGRLHGQGRCSRCSYNQSRCGCIGGHSSMPEVTHWLRWTRLLLLPWKVATCKIVKSEVTHISCSIYSAN